MGTRFVAVTESVAHPYYKQAIIGAKDTDIVITCRKLLPTRSLKTEFSRKLLGLEKSGASASDIRDFRAIVERERASWKVIWLMVRHTAGRQLV